MGSLFRTRHYDLRDGDPVFTRPWEEFLVQPGSIPERVQLPVSRLPQQLGLVARGQVMVVSLEQPQGLEFLRRCAILSRRTLPDPTRHSLSLEGCSIEWLAVAEIPGVGKGDPKQWPLEQLGQRMEDCRTVALQGHRFRHDLIQISSPAKLPSEMTLIINEILVRARIKNSTTLEMVEFYPHGGFSRLWQAAAVATLLRQPPQK